MYAIKKFQKGELIKKVGRVSIYAKSTFWQKAAEVWDALGKPFKRQECQAAAKALSLALAII